MPEHATNASLIWITKTQAINPAAVVSVFHSDKGHIEINLVGGDLRALEENELSEEGRKFFLPPTENANHADSSRSDSLAEKKDIPAHVP